MSSPIKIFKNLYVGLFIEDLILVQDERWRRG